MSIICPNFKNKEVAAEFEELKNATSEAAAYHIWSQNNGNSIDKAPNGEPSKLFSDLLEHYNGDKVLAIQAKARTFSESFKNWFGESKVVDENGEPLIVWHGSDASFDMFKTTVDSPEYNKSNEWVYDHEAVEEDGKYYIIDSGKRQEISKDKYDRYQAGETIQILDIAPNAAYFSSEKEVSKSYLTPIHKYTYDGELDAMWEEEMAAVRAAERDAYYDKFVNQGYDSKTAMRLAKEETSKSRQEAESRLVQPFFLSVTNPADYDAEGKPWNRIPIEGGDTTTRELESFHRDTNDGVIVKDVVDIGVRGSVGETNTVSSNVFIVYTPGQVKSIDNQGTFSTQDNNIYLAGSSKNAMQLSNMQQYNDSTTALNSMTSDLAKVVKDTAEKVGMKPIFIEYIDQPLSEIYPEASYWTPAVYDRANNKIVVNRNGDFSRYGSLENVILHEIIHALTLDSLASDTQAANELREIQKEYAAKHSDHASKNVYEFAAELFSNPDVIFNMQDFHASNGEKTLLQKLLDWFKRLFSKNTTHQDLVNKILDNVVEFNAYKTLESRENTDDYIPEALPAASKREEIASIQLRSVFSAIVKTAETRFASLKYNNISDKFDRNEAIRNDKLLSSLKNIQNSLKDMEGIENITDYINGTLEYVDSIIYSVNEAEAVISKIEDQLSIALATNNVNEINKLSTALDNFGAEYLYPHESNLRRIHNELNDELNSTIFELAVGDSELKNTISVVEGLIQEFSSSKMSTRNNIGFRYKNLIKRAVEKKLRDEMKDAKDESVDSALMNWLTFDGDLSWYHKFLFTPVSSPQPIFRLVRKIIGDVNNKTHKQVYNKYAEIKLVASKTRDHTKLFETDEKGNKTGYFLRDRRYGVYQNKKYKWRKEWLKNHKFASVDELKLYPDLWVDYQIAYNDFKSAEVERRYTPEFYAIFARLSMDANIALSEVNTDIENFTKPFLDDETKKPRFEKMTREEHSQYLALLERKRNLANPYDAITGELKPEGSVEYKIAMELTAAYEELAKGLKSKINMEAFLEEMEKMKNTPGYTPDGLDTIYSAWLERNTKWEFTEEFQELLSKQNKADFGETYDRLYKARYNLLKLYRTDQYEVDYIRMPQAVKDKIKQLDIAMYRVRQNAKRGGASLRLFKSELSQIAKDNGGKDAVLAEDIWVDDKGVRHYHSYMTTVKPINQKYMHRVPNSQWAETSEEAAYYNHNYDRNIPEAEQPKLSIKEYDNRKEYNAVMRDPNLKRLYDTFISIMDESNNMISHARYKNNYKLPQKNGHIFRYIGGKGLVTGVRDYMLDGFTLNPDDELNGVKVETRPDGTDINIMPTMYTSMLTDPSVGTNDLVDAVIRYYRMACNYKNKKDVAPQLNLLDSLISKEGRIEDGKTSKQAENSDLAKSIHKYIGYHLYGRSNTLKDFTINGRRISLEKIFRYYSDLGRDLGLAWNPRSAISGGIAAYTFYAADSIINRYINKRDFLVANSILTKEIVNLKLLRQLGRNMANSKMIGVLEYNGMSFNQEAEFSNTNRWRLGRIVQRVTEPYAFFKLASILPNSTFAIGMYLNYKLIKLEDGQLHFISENDFLDNHFPNLSIEEKKAIYDNTKENLWNAYEMVEKGFKPKNIYKRYITEDLENEITNKLNTISSHAEGMVEEADKSGIYLNTALSTILMFRAFIPKNIENTLSPMYWNYQTKELAMGTVSSYYYTFGLQNIFNIGKKNYEKQVKLYGKERVQKQIKRYQKRATAQIITYFFWLTLFNLFSLGFDDDDDYWYSNFMKLELKKVSLEAGSRYNAMDVFNILNSLTPLINTGEDLYRAFCPIAYFSDRKWEKIKKGSYKGLYGWQRDLLKVNRYANAYYNMKNPGEKLRNLSNTLN